LESNWRWNVYDKQSNAFQPTLAARLVADPDYFVFQGTFFPGLYFVGKVDPAFLPRFALFGTWKTLPPGARFPYGEIVLPD